MSGFEKRWLKKGIRLLEETLGDGNMVERQRYYFLAIRLTLSRGEIVRHPAKCLSHSIDEHLDTTDDGYLHHRVRIHRENLIGGVFYTVQGMRVGGYRKVEIAPHLAYGHKGIAGVIPPNALVTAEIRVVDETDPF